MGLNGVDPFSQFGIRYDEVIGWERPLCPFGRLYDELFVDKSVA